MKWVESDFVNKGKTFSIMDLELGLDKLELRQLFQAFDDKTKTIVSYHLHFDFLFMAGVFPGIASICMLTWEKIASERKSLRSILFVLAALQLAAWGFDIYENTALIKWLNNPASIDNDNIELYHFLVRSKFIIAFAGVIATAIAFLFFRKNKSLKS
jgi:hypothetical protein